MKKFLFLIAFLAIAPALFALPFSELIISLDERVDFYAEVNGRKYESYNGRVFVNNLRHGNCYIEVYKYGRSLRGFNLVRVFSGNVDIRPNKRIYAVIDITGRFVISRVENLNPNSNYVAPNHHYYDEYCEDDYYNYGYNNNYNNTYCVGMAPESFNMLLNTMENIPFDKNKMNVAISAISANGINCMQLTEVMRKLSFDSNRLELAKRAYRNVVDKNNAFVLSNAFNFRSNADEFFIYIGAVAW